MLRSFLIRTLTLFVMLPLTRANASARFHQGDPRKLIGMLKLNRVTASLFVLLFCFTALAQRVDHGKFNTWGTAHFARNSESVDNTRLRSVRVAKQKEFDRVVFEFDGGLPNHDLKYLAGRIYEDDGEAYCL